MKLYLNEKEDRLTLDEYLEIEGENQIDELLKLKGFWKEYFKENLYELYQINAILEKKEKYEERARRKIREIIKKNKRKCIEISE